MNLTTTASTSTAPPRTGAIVTLVIGALLTITGPVLGVLIGSFATVPAVVSFGESIVRIDPASTLDLDAGEEVLLLAPVADLEDADHERCEAHTEDGTAATVAYAPASTLNTLVDGTRYESFARVTAATSGELSITCETDTDVVATPPFQLSQVFGPLAWWTAGGFVVSLLGVVLVIIGVVRLSRTRHAG